MSKHFFLIIALLALTSGFSYTPIFKEFCGNLSGLTISINDSELNKSYTNLTEFPKEVLEVFNAKLLNNSDLVMLLKTFNNVTFSAEIYYNKTSCFSGSIHFFNSSIDYIKLASDELKGTDNNHIYFYAELINLEQIINEWMVMSKNANNDPLKVISLGIRSFGTVFFGLLMNDFYVKPLSGIMKVFDLLKVLPQLSVSKEFMSNLNTTMIKLP
ncbi:MAG: hypothetical protein PHN56_02990 [Candidatus Nanoarchaeia archaeon]|nr:hypothetical protein [Candidatus Nanoarchaeia archaeon]